MNQSPVKITRSEIFGISGIIVFAVLLLLVGSQFDLNFISEYVKKAGIWAPIVFIVFKASTIVFAPLSGTPLYLLVGTLFGLGEGILYAFIGDLLGFSVLFFLGKFYGLRVIHLLTNKKDLKIIDKIKTYTNDVRSFIKITLVFFWFPEATIAASGLGKLGYLKVMLIFMPVYTLITSLIIFISSTILS